MASPRPDVPSARLKPREYHVLLALASGAQHGLAIAREVERLSDGVVRLWPAALYGTLEDLVDRGWIEPSAPPAGESEKRRYYALAPAGRRALAAETNRLSAVVKEARSRLRRTGEVS